MSQLDKRARKVLSAIIQEYLATGDAVGSRTITRRHGVDISPATVRNVMADLEDAGLLTQPHTSAGRLPTTQGLRFFVDSMLKVRTLNAREKDDIRDRYSFADGELDTALRDAGKVLSELSQLTVVVTTPRLDHDILDHIEFVRLPTGALLSVMMLRSGQVQNRIIQPTTPIDADVIERIHRFTREHLGQHSLVDVRRAIAKELAGDRARYNELERRALEISAQALDPGVSDATEVIVEGQARLLEAGNSVDVEKMRALFQELEEKQKIVNLLELTEQAESLQVFIGAETNIGELSDFSVVAVPYGSDERALGSLGVIGPNFMNYSRVISLVDFTAELVSGLISGK